MFNYLYITFEENKVKILLITAEDNSVLDRYTFYLLLISCYAHFSRPDNNPGFLHLFTFIQSISDAAFQAD
jgi:hypothetical protein